MKLTLLAALLLSACGRLAAEPMTLETYKTEQARCSALSADESLRALRGSFPLTGADSATEEMMRTGSVPSAAQVAALRWFKANVIACNERIVDLLVGDSDAAPAIQLRRRVEALKLNLLIGGRITFGDYAAMQRLSVLNENYYRVQIAELQDQVAKAKTPAPLVGLLACALMPRVSPERNCRLPLTKQAELST